MKTILCLTVCGLFLAAATTFATLDIVKSGADWVVGDTSSGRVLGTFWNPDDSSSDFGYEGGSGKPEFFWSKERQYVAVNGGASRSRQVYLYQVVGKSLKPVEIPGLSDEQAADINALKDVRADGADAVRWQGDDTLLVHFWAVDRVRGDEEEGKKADVWADVEVNDGEAKIVGTSSEQPDAPSSQSSFPNPAPPSGETL